MLVSHSETSKLKIPQILKIFWPAWEPCREATSEYSDSIFPVRILRILAYQPCIYEGMGMHSVDTLVCRSWGKYRWIMEIAGQNVLFWRGSSNGYISKQLIDTGWNFPPLFLYDRATILCSYNVLIICVSVSGTSNVKIPEILEIIWPASEPCREATSMYSDTVFPVRILRILTYQPCKYEGIGMHSVDTLICRSWGKYRWIMEIARQNVLFCRGSIKRLDLQMTYRYRLKLSASIPIWQGYHPL